MTFTASAASPPVSSSLEADARNLARALDRRSLLLLALLTLLYTASAVHHAQGKPLWYDEIITTIAAGAPDAASTWKIAQRTDINPPLPHLLIHFSMRCFGSGEAGTRVPAIAGFWIFCLCLYRFVRRRLGLFYGLTALLIPIVTDAWNFSVEARGYGLELGFCGLALIGWQSAIENPRKLLPLTGVTVGLLGATLCHYYAILLYLPFAGAEAFRWLRSGRFEWRIWAAFAAGGLALAWPAFNLATGARFVLHPWATPSPGQMLEFWEAGLQHLPAFLALLLAVLALAAIAAAKTHASALLEPPCLAAHELVAGVLFLAIPIAAVTGALLVTHMFTPRYALCSLAGFAFLVPMAAAWYTNGRALFGFLLVVVLSAAFAISALAVPAPGNPFSAEPILERALRNQAVVVPDGLLFLQMWHYAPAPLKSRLVYLADNNAAVRYMVSDSIDEGLRVLPPYAPVNVIDYRAFAAPGKEFWVYQNTLRPGWLLPEVLDKGASAQVTESDGYRELIRVRLKP